MAERILVVDDDPRVREVLARFLEREGYVTVPATSGEEALERVASQPPDLVLLDVQLPGIDGYTVCRVLKENEATALIPVTILTGLQDAEARTRGIESGADDFINKPFEYTLLRARLRTQLRIKRLTDQLESTERVVFSMARWVEIKDPYTEGHLRRIAGYSEQTALALGLPAEQARVVRYAGVLHDIGKIGVREELLSKPGKLTREEQMELRKHAEYGASIVAPMRFAGDVAPIILAHHEHWDGAGYPYGQRGEQIPLGARIISVVDAYDAMTSDRPYRKSLGNEEAVRRLRAGSGTQWDPTVLDVFLSLLEAGQLKPVELPGHEPVVGHLPIYPNISASDRRAA
ncbi:MAG: response regulator [Candidatus Eisenbacteria bacterium]|uniref:Response regulator n=1 Tax=Eiseniibacteriota bacterium TaxID=2212470 RepID=A0A538U5M2_UNCEI|nr:MAG: response regulator [Candidatus Eisenbacteria bacterium]